ncbi:hypothetical protein [Photobacterium sanguinicancri]|uniref:hypothetical protein n=1 Tax=Photobacterium sanguinicancri TaxID=875932 RepID=UPI0024810DE1|nr:hypothetical protein [Photobacterium sanguinicancri]
MEILNIKKENNLFRKELNTLILNSMNLNDNYNFTKEVDIYNKTTESLNEASKLDDIYLSTYNILRSCDNLKYIVNDLTPYNSTSDEKIIKTHKIKALLDTQEEFLSNQLSQLNVIINIKRIEDKDNYIATSKELKDIVRSKIKTIEDTFSISSSNLNDLINDGKVKLKTTISDYEKITVDKILETEESASNRIQIRIRNIDTNISKYQSTVQSAENSIKDETQIQYESLRKLSSELRDEVIALIDKSSSSSLESIQTEQSKALTSFSAKSQDEVSKINKKIEAEVREFEGKKKEIELILGEISTQHQSAANTIQANKEEKSADLFRYIGMGWLIFTIFLSIYIFNDYIGLFPIADGKTIIPLKDLGFEWFAIRFTTITLLTTPGVYMLKESASHRAKENLYRQRGTQLSSIGAYLGEMNSEERAKLKVDLAKNFFSFHDSKPDTSNVPDFIKNMKEAIEIAKAISPQQSSSNKEDKKENTQKA